jgi:site-specific DNA recombinase
MNKPAAIYARVATNNQVNRKNSLPSQIKNCTKFAELNGFDIAAIYQDEISGAKPIATRPDGGRLQRAIKARQIKAVIVYRLDRLSRDSIDLLTTVRDWLRDGVELYALDIGQITGELGVGLKTSIKRMEKRS